MKKEFEINLEIYEPSILNEAIDAFEDVGGLLLNDNIITIEAESIEVADEIFYEYMNYCIGIFNIR